MNLTQFRKLIQKEIRSVLKENGVNNNYMFFQNLKTIKRSVEQILLLNSKEVDAVLSKHNWALDHIATAADDIAEVSQWIQNELNS